MSERGEGCFRKLFKAEQTGGRRSSRKTLGKQGSVVSTPSPPPALLYVITVLPNEDTVCIFRPRMVACFLALSSLLPVLLTLKETHFPTCIHHCSDLPKPRQLLPPELGGIVCT